MLKLGLASLVAAALATLSIVSFSGTADAAKPCARKKFESKLVADACKSGGQEAAKKAMKTWMKDAKKKRPSLGCASCHSKVAGDYPLKPTADKQYKDLGGK